ncbi:hypothetical protein D9613_006599 [Agrocybe pediades]|uniref:VPS9 domain-containing protein n=1 Tax=Agrocybe pediades TaxID=84607 RepID=A0A8H4VIR7_9AGAR|nr:hypothetical protein D9613_006599 [Agrocybe pediades]
MASKREHDFPATSIGRSSGARLQQPSAAHEAHPLLSPGPSSPTPSEHSHTGSITGPGATLSVNGGPKYVPYTPRQRVTPTAATTGMTAHPSSPQHQHGDATSKLQLMHLKAAAQGIGLDSGTLGWLILEKLVVNVEVSEEWVEIWSAITTGKATLLLPLESAFTNEKITADFVKDHIVLCDGPQRNGAPFVTLSGLRGTLDDQTLTFRSTLYSLSKPFQDILNPATRTNALSLLPPLPNIPSPPTYPQFEVPSYSSSLHLPPRAAAPNKPPLPPRPGNRSVSASSNAVPSRITNPFASLFGSKSTAPIPPSPPSSLHSLDDSSSPVEVSAFTINRRVVRKDVAKEINKALKNEIKSALSSTSVPPWIAERVHEVTSDWYPFIRNKRNGKEGSNGNGYIVNSIEEHPDDAAERLQDFYMTLEQDMRAGGTPFLPRRRDKDGEPDPEDEKGRERREHDRMESETKIREVMEAVERTISGLFYDRLFMQTTTDDASHDEALSSRVAALNMLDLGLGHLGIEVGEAMNEPELDAVVKACGDLLSQLDTCHNPGDKATILVAAHKVVVDGLSRLPPIRLISEDDTSQEEPPLTAKPFTTVKVAGLEPDNAEADLAPLAPQALSGNEDISSVNTSTTSPAGSAEPSSVPSYKSNPPPPLPLRTHPTSESEPTAVAPVPAAEPKLKLSSPQKEPTPVSGDVLLPLIIFSVVKANPPHLVSNLLFTQRFRNQSVGGEESYCLINLMAVAEFLENVDMAGLGLGDSDKVMSIADLTPIPLTRSPVSSETPLEPIDAYGGIRGRVGQQVDAIADSANKVISGVVDSSFGILRSFMPVGGGAGVVDPKSPSGGRLTPGTPRHGFGLLRRESGFSIASLAASLPISRTRSNTTHQDEEAGQQLVTVSRPSSVKSRSSMRSGHSLRIRVGDQESHDEDGSEEDEESVTSNDEDDEEGSESDAHSERGGDEFAFDYDADEPAGPSSLGAGDTRSIRSFESMLSASKEKEKDNSRMSRARKSLSDRLASVSALASGKRGNSPPPETKRNSLLLQPSTSSVRHEDSPSSSRAASPSPAAPGIITSPPVRALRLAPPKQRFMECTPDDLRLSEVGELLREYRRLVEGIKAVDGFIS